MKSEKIINALGNIDDKYIIEAHGENKKGIRIAFSLRTIGKLAVAGLCLVLTLTILPRYFLGSSKKEAATETISDGSYNFGIYEEAKEDDYRVEEDAVVLEKLIVKGQMRVETLKLDELVNTINESLKNSGGYIQSSWINNGNRRYYEATLRIPAEHYSSIIAEIKGNGNCISYEETTDDITSSYYDTEAKLKSLEAEEERVLEFYSEAENVRDLIEVENRLSELRSEIESLKTAMQNYDLLTTYSTLNITIEETKAYSESDESFIQRLGRTFSRGFINFISGVEELVLDIVYNIWTLLATALIFVTAIIAYKKIRNRKK